MKWFSFHKSKYLFDTETLSFRKIEISSTEIGNLLLSRFFVTLLIGIILAIPAYIFIPTPYHKILVKKNQDLRLKYEILENQIAKISKNLTEIHNRDNNAYRPIFEADSIPESMQKAGSGGTDKYSDLKKQPGGEHISATFSKIDNLSRQLIVQSKSFDAIVKMLNETQTLQQAMPTLQPVANKYITGFCPFSLTGMLNGKEYRFHPGVDLCAPANTEIYASGAGIVSKISFHRSLGNYIYIQHGYGIMTVYGHLNKALVTVGQKVKRGDLIALMGTTGMSSVVHLHYEIHKNGKQVDPVNYYYNDISDAEYEQLVKLSSKKPFSD